MSVDLFGHTYDAPFGISPIGLQGLMWPKTPEILAAAAFKHNVPFCLSTVSTSSIETIAEITQGRAWFQLYHPAEDKVRDDIINRAKAAELPVLVILADVPTFGYRPEIFATVWRCHRACHCATSCKFAVAPVGLSAR